MGYRKCPSLPVLVLTLPPKWALLRWQSPPPSAFSLLPLLPTLEPGTGSSHPGNVRRQGPPRWSKLGHPIRRKSVSYFTMAGPAANIIYFGRRYPLPSSRILLSQTRSVFLLYSLHPSPIRSKKNVTGHRKSKSIAHPLKPFSLLLPLVMLSFECANVRTCARVTDSSAEPTEAKDSAGCRCTNKDRRS